MRNLLNWICGKSQVRLEEHKGINSVIHIIEKHPEKTFFVMWPGRKSSGIPAQEVIRFVREELPDYYDYYAKIRTYVNKQKVAHVEIEIHGTIVLRGKPGRYNPFDIKVFIKTNKQ